jgi:hypothetical protein
MVSGGLGFERKSKSRAMEEVRRMKRIEGGAFVFSSSVGPGEWVRGFESGLKPNPPEAHIRGPGIGKS